MRFGTVRGRLAALMTDQLLLYGTGGLAYGQVELSGNTISAAHKQLQTPVLCLLGRRSLRRAPRLGFQSAAGSRVNFRLRCRLTGPGKLEYLYLDLGSFDALTFYTTALPAGSPLSGAIATHTHFTDNIVRVGLNYKFGNYYAPVVTK
jgi:outer membrane immunogenic protein